jgi:hypothetical protein
VVFAAGSAAAPSITTTGDTNTGIFFPAADTIAFTEGGVEAARFDSSGNLGIGTSSPSAKLHVVGSQYRQNDSTGSFGFTLNTTSSTTTLATLFGGSSFAIQTGGSGTNQLTLDSSGNLGIGTSSPSVRLHSKSSLAENTIIEGTTARGGGNVYASFYDPTGRKGYFGYSGSDDSFNFVNEMNAYMLFGTNGNERMRIDANGNIVAGASAALATTATNGFLYVPTCAGTPTGTPTAITGMAPIVVDTTNNKLYFYSTGVWRDAGP